MSQTRITRCAPWRNRTLLSVALALIAGLALRLWLFYRSDGVWGDSLLYGDIAKNLLLHGRYAFTEETLRSTLIRLPGYPFLLAALFKLFGMENYAAAAWLQIPLDLAGCLLVASFTRRIASTGAAHCALWLAALCPFTAIFAGKPLAETPTLFFLTLALWSAARFRSRPAWPEAIAFTFACAGAALMRPDGVLVAIALTPTLLLTLFGKNRSALISPRKSARMAIACTLLALAPFALWTWRNWRVFHVFEPLAPRSAADPGEYPNLGWDRWTGTWCLDFASTYEIYWNVPFDVFDPGLLPARAFDSIAERAQVEAIAAEYKARGNQLTPALDQRFAQLAEQRIQAHPWRSRLWLPLGRLADMWLRPRNENLAIEPDWWAFRNHPAETFLSLALAALNLVYLLLAALGLWHRPALWRPMLAYMLLRSALLLTITAPEARYTIECFPMLFALAGVGLYRLSYTVFESTGKTKASLGKA